ncbi:MAG TPA: nucleotidyltransferase family protein [Candidatus Binatia bacterium]|nr:nucleotidyltransferase family protein [Candidatus Binatia bacterium]
MSISLTKPALCHTLSVLLPTPDQTVFLRACLSSGEAGRKAYEDWRARRGESEKALREGYGKSLLPLLFHTLQRNGAGANEEFLTVLRAASLREELRTTTYRRLCRRALLALTTAGIPIIALKGAVLADTVYGHPTLRHSHDIDLLLRESDPSHTVSLLSSVGFTSLRREIDTAWQDIHLVHESGLPLVLHRRLFRTPCYNTATTDLWARSRTQAVADVPVRVLAPVDQLVHVCGHAASCASRESLRWVCDAWLLITRYPDLDWETVLDCSSRSHLTLPLAVTLGYLAEELQAPIPATFLRRLYAAASRATTAEREAALWGARAGARGRYRDLLRLTGDWRTRVFVLRWMLFPSPASLCPTQRVRRSWRSPFSYLSRLVGKDA